CLFFSSRRRHTSFSRDWSSDVCSSDLVGITLLPETICSDAVRNGTLKVVLPQWRLPQGISHAVFASRRGMLPAVRVFIDFLAEKLPPLIETARLGCGEINGKPCSAEEEAAFRRQAGVP